jgi:hypothetical protein
MLTFLKYHWTLNFEISQSFLKPLFLQTRQSRSQPKTWCEERPLGTIKLHHSFFTHYSDISHKYFCFLHFVYGLILSIQFLKDGTKLSSDLLYSYLNSCLSECFQWSTDLRKLNYSAIFVAVITLILFLRFLSVIT